jgi:hypothetical protein
LRYARKSHSRISNILPVFLYVCLSPLHLFLAMIARPGYDGFLGILGWMVVIIMGAAPVFSALPSTWSCFSCSAEICFSL